MSQNWIPLHNTTLKKSSKRNGLKSYSRFSSPFQVKFLNWKQLWDLLSPVLPQRVTQSPLASSSAKGDPVPKVNQDACLQVAKDLFGSCRWASRRAHYACLHKDILLRDPSFPPWDESKLQRLLNTLRADGVIPQKVQQVWNTVNFLSSKLGLLELDSAARLKQRRNPSVWTALPPS